MAAKGFCETALLGTVYRLHGCAWGCTLSSKVTRFRKVDPPKKLEINEKLRELDELHRMVDGIPSEILQAAKQVAAHKPQER